MSTIKKKRGHEENRHIVCASCHKKNIQCTAGWAELPHWTKILTLMEELSLDIKTKRFAKFQFYTTNFAHGRTPPFPGKVVVPHFWIVLLVSLMTPKRIELITRDWSEIEDILEKSMINFQNEEWGGPWGTPRGPQRTKNDQILTFLGFCHHPSHSGRIFLLLLR